MNATLRIAALLAIVLYFSLLFYLLKNKSLHLKYTLLWMLSGLIMLFFILSPSKLDKLASLVGIYEPANALFAIMIFCILIILMSLTAIVSKMNERIKKLTQSLGLLEEAIRAKEEEPQQK